MATTEQLLFELQRRVILFKSTTTMPDNTQLGYDGNPNDVTSGGTNGEKLIYYCPAGTRFMQSDGTQWVKTLAPNEWVQFATGNVSLTGHKYLTPKSYNEVATDVATEAELIAAIAAATDFDTINVTADITITATLIINKPLKITTLTKKVLQTAGTAGDPTLMISVTADDVYITEELTVKHRSTAVTSVECAISVVAERFISRCTLEYMEFGYQLNGSWSISGSISHVGVITNSHRMFSIYDMTNYSEFTNVEFDFNTDDALHKSILVDTSAGGKINGMLRIANVYQKDLTKIGHQFLNLASYATDTSIGLIVEDCTFRMSGGDIFSLVSATPLDNFDFIALTGNTSIPGQSAAADYKGLFYLSGSGSDLAMGSTDFYYANNNHGHDLRPTYISLHDSGGIVYNNAVFLPTAQTVVEHNWSPFFLTSTKLWDSLADAPHDKGWFANETALTTAYPTGVAGDWAIVGATDTVWIWDTDTVAWVDSGSGSIVSWGSIGGSIANQTDLQAALDAATVDGAVFISDLNPTTTGNVGIKTYSSDGAVLESCITDTNSVTVSVLALTGHTNYIPVVTINSTPVTLVAESDAPLFRGTLAIDLAGAETLTVVHEDGAENTIDITHETAPVVTAANFTGGYPGSQTELKEDDVYDFYLTSDSDIVKVQFDDYGAFKSQEFTVAAGTEFTVLDVVVADRDTTLQALGAKVRVQKASGSWSDWYLTENDGSVDGTNLVNLNNLFPTISFGVIGYPASQGAIKGTTEEATVANTVSDYDTIVYSSPNSEISIANTTTYEASKVATRLTGDYNVSVDNFRITATRAANAAVSVDNTVVKIADVAPVVNITIVGSPARLRSGGNDGTAAQNYTIRITSSQDLYSAPTLVAPKGTFQGGGFTGGPAIWDRSLQIHDDDLKGATNFTSLSAIGLAAVEQTSINSGAGYELGGFVSRDIEFAAFTPTADMNVEAITYAKVTFVWPYWPSVVDQEPVGTTADTINAWCLDAIGYGINPTTIRILDLDKVGNTSRASIVTIEEVA